jgi:hypothetical protein
MTDAPYHDAEQRIEHLTLAFGICGALAALVLRGWRFGLGMAIGGALSWLNYRWLKGGISTLAQLSDVKPGEPAPRTPPGIYLKFLGRFVLLLAVVYVILSRPFVPVASVLFGLFAAVAGVLAEMVYQLLRGSRAADGA